MIRGIVRPMDHLGRVVIPSEYRKSFGLKKGSLMEIISDGKTLIVKKFSEECFLCGTDANDNIEIGGIYICRACADKISKINQEKKNETE